MQWRVDDFYDATLAELFDAAKGWRESEHEKTQLMFFAARRIAWISVLPHIEKGITESEIWPLEIDEDEREELIKEFGFVKITRPDGD